MSLVVPCASIERNVEGHYASLQGISFPAALVATKMTIT